MIERLLQERSRPGARVLDLGSGDGALVARLGSLGYRALGVDVNLRRLKTSAQRRGSSNGALTRFVCADATQVPFHEASFDAIVSNSVFEHLPDPASAFRECRRILRDDGFLLVNVPHRWGPREGHVPAWFPHWLPAGNLRRTYLDLCGKDGCYWDAYISRIHYWSPTSLKRDMERTFEQVEIVSLRRYEPPVVLTTRAQRWILALLRGRVTRWLGRWLVHAMGHVDALGVAGVAHRAESGSASSADGRMPPAPACQGSPTVPPRA